MTRALPEERVELRLALVCYGGVSLAVYMHGVTKELHKLVQASRTFDAVEDLDAANPFGDDDSAGAYFEALREIAGKGRRLSVAIDVIAGTSAGGINGVVLGKVLARGGSQEKLKRLWIDEGDLRTLLRAPAVGGVKVRAALAALTLLGSQLFGKDKATSPLKGERMSELLVGAIEDIDASADGTLVPPAGSLDLFVTATDLQGFEMLVPTGAGGASQRDRQHAQVLRFSADATDTGQFGPTAGTRALAFAARATSAFPGAFAPISAGSFGTESGRELDTAFLAQRFVYPYEENGAKAVNAWFVDGGVLDNAPFDHVVEAIGGKRAESQVVRRIVYIQPDPGRPLGPAAPDHGPTPPPPTWLAGLMQAVFEVKGNHDVLRDLLALRDLNLHIAEVGSIAETQMAAVQSMLDDAVPRGEDQELSWVVSAEAFQAVSDTVHRTAATRLGAGYSTYSRLKLEAAARRMADEVARRFVYPPDARRSSFLRAAVGAWARGLDEWTDPDPTRLLELLRPADMPYRDRRLLFLLAGINGLYGAVGEGPAAPRRADLDALKARAWDLLDQLRRIPGEVADDVDADFVSPGALDVDPFADPESFAATHAQDFQALFAAYSKALKDRLGDGGTELWLAFQTETGAWDKKYRRDLLSRYLAFPFWDGLIFPTVALARLPQFTPIGVAQFSPLAAAALPTPDKGKLKGVGLSHFAGFLESAWRQNDYLWGRLDGVELNLRTLYDAGSSDPAVARTTRPSAEDVVRTAGGPVLQRGLRAVLASEADLTEIAEDMKTWRGQVDRLPVENSSR